MERWARKEEESNNYKGGNISMSLVYAWYATLMSYATVWLTHCFLSHWPGQHSNAPKHVIVAPVQNSTLHFRPVFSFIHNTYHTCATCQRCPIASIPKLAVNNKNANKNGCLYSSYDLSLSLSFHKILLSYYITSALNPLLYSIDTLKASHEALVPSPDFVAHCKEYWKLLWFLW